MFTGLVEETARILSVEPMGGGARLTLEAAVVLEGTQAGDSLAVNGCCLTITAREGNRLSFDLLAETLDKTNLGDQKPGSLANLERALAANGRLGGHFVQGHVDTTARILALEPHGQDHRMEIELPPAFARYVAYKGSIAINFACTFVPRHFCSMRAQNAFAFSQRAIALSRSFQSKDLRCIHAHRASTRAISLFLIFSRSFILIFIRYVFWFKGGTFTIPPAPTKCCK